MPSRSPFTIALIFVAGCGGGSTYRPPIKTDAGVDMAMAMCQQGMTSCGGVCVDTTSDANNCGVCGKVCAMGEQCMGSVCKGGMMCPQGTVDCGGDCVDLKTDPMNCGMCAKACLQTESCTAGICKAGGGNLTGCTGAVQCINKCMDQSCYNACLKNTNPTGAKLLQALLMCIQTTCPSAKMGDPCFQQNQTCSACLMKAQGMGGACFKALMDCAASKP